MPKTPWCRFVEANRSSLNRKLLVINFGGIGDEILFLPTLKTLRRHFPEWHITLLLEPRSRSFEQLTNLIDDTIVFDIKKRPLMVGDILDLLGLMRGGYDVVVSSGGSKPVSVLLFLSGIPVRIGYDSGPHTHLLLDKPRPLNQKQYAGNMYHDLVSFMDDETQDFALLNSLLRKEGVRIDYVEDAERVSKEEAEKERAEREKVLQVPEISVSAGAVEQWREFLHKAANESAPNTVSSNPQAKFVLLHPGTSRLAVEKGIIKTWPTENWMELIQKIAETPDLKPVLAGGPDDKEIVEEMLSTVSGKAKEALISTIGKTKNLADLAALTAACDVLICVDSAPMHIGVALQKPVVALFGPTDESKLIPMQEPFVVLREPQEMLTGSPRTLLDGLGVRLQPDSVFQALLDRLQAAQNPRSCQGILR